MGFIVLYPLVLILINSFNTATIAEPPVYGLKAWRDAFNEYGVQIMTPAYEGDPEAPKVVPKEQWFSLPAKPGEAEERKSPLD